MAALGAEGSCPAFAESEEVLFLEPSEEPRPLMRCSSSPPDEPPNLSSSSSPKRKREQATESPGCSRPAKVPRKAPTRKLDLSIIDSRLSRPFRPSAAQKIEAHRNSFRSECEYLLVLDDERIKEELKTVGDRVEKQKTHLQSLLQVDRESPKHKLLQDKMRAETRVQQLQRELEQAKQDVENASRQLELIREKGVEIRKLETEIEEEELSLTHLRMENARRADKKPCPFNALPLSLFGKIGSYISYRHEIPEVAQLSKTFYKSCEEFRFEFRKAPGIMVTGAGTPAVNGFYVRRESRTSMPKNWPHSEDYWRRTTDGRPWYEGNGEIHMTFAPLWYIHSAARPYYKVPQGDEILPPVDEERWVQSLSGFGRWPCPTLEFRDPDDPEVVAFLEAQDAQDGDDGQEEAQPSD